MEKLKVLVVDDTIVYRRVIAEAVEATGIASAVQTASNGNIALERLSQGRFDVVLLDVNMPELDGLAALELMKLHHPEVVVIMFSSQTCDSAITTVKALEKGALDFIVKPMEAYPDKNIQLMKNHLTALFTQILVEKYSSFTPQSIEKIANKGGKADEHVKDRDDIGGQGTKQPFQGADLVLIASSTGGPVALKAILSDLHGDLQIPVLVVQHMPHQFTKSLAYTLNNQCQIPVVEAEQGDLIEGGKVLIAPGGVHMTVMNRGKGIQTVQLEGTALVNGVRPAADVLFRSIAQAYEGERILVVVLTGMGYDGLAGVKEMKRKTICYCITQSEDTCVVYGMPKTIKDAGLSNEEVPLGDIANRIQLLAADRGVD